MAEAPKRTAAPRKSRSIEDEIARQEAKLRKLQDNLKEKKRREYERNAKAISALLQIEHLDQVPVETWQQQLPRIKALLLESPTGAAPGDPKEKPAPTVPGTADAG